MTEQDVIFYFPRPQRNQNFDCLVTINECPYVNSCKKNWSLLALVGFRWRFSVDEGDRGESAWLVHSRVASFNDLL